jgi:hypothetical protein
LRVELKWKYHRWSNYRKFPRIKINDAILATCAGAMEPRRSNFDEWSIYRNCWLIDGFIDWWIHSLIDWSIPWFELKQMMNEIFLLKWDSIFHLRSHISHFTFHICFNIEIFVMKSSGRILWFLSNDVIWGESSLERTFESEEAMWGDVRQGDVRWDDMRWDEMRRDETSVWKPLDRRCRLRLSVWHWKSGKFYDWRKPKFEGRWRCRDYQSIVWEDWDMTCGSDESKRKWS